MMCSIGLGWHELVRNYPLNVGGKVTFRVIADNDEDKHFDIRARKV